MGFTIQAGSASPAQLSVRSATMGKTATYVRQVTSGQLSIKFTPTTVLNVVITARHASLNLICALNVDLVCVSPTSAA